ncbi:MAG: chemotaxis protein CheW [Desulfovibrio sp.]|uniref:chemotaxis protein CheW n=1 Tax=Desulfovibrio sp. 7SRBS1 TaxID=3378064 RepID=UPI003B3F891D
MNLETPEVARCWKIMGSYGDKSCPELLEHGLCINCPVFSAHGRSLFDRPMPEGETDLWARLLAEEKLVPPTGLVSAIVFKLRQEWLALPTRCFVEIMDMCTVRAIPGRSNPVFRGLVNYGGELVPCMSTAALLGILAGKKNSGENMLSQERMAVVSHNNEQLVIRIDEILGVVRYQPGGLREPPATLRDDSKRFTVGILTQKRFGGGQMGAQAYKEPEMDVAVLDVALLFEAFTRSMAR